MNEITIRAADMPRDLPVVQQLCWEYRDYLCALGDDMRTIVDLFYPIDAYTKLMEALPVKHARPLGCIFLAERDGVPEGCGMSHPLNKEDCEIKRVFIRENLRGKHAGERLSNALIMQARADGYKRILLDTNVKLTSARKLYEKMGFHARGPYSDVPQEALPLLAFYELAL